QCQPPLARAHRRTELSLPTAEGQASREPRPGAAAILSELRPSTYPQPPYQRLGRSLVRIQLDVRVMPELAETAHDVLRAHGSEVTQELDGAVVRGCFASVPQAAAARDAVLALDARSEWSVDQTFWYDLESHY